MATSDGDTQLRVLEQIRDEVRGTNARLESVDHRLQATNDRLESLESRVEESNRHLESLDRRVERVEGHTVALGDRLDAYGRRQTESEPRLSTEVLALADVTRQVRDLLSQRLDDHDSVVDHERRLAEIEKRLG